MNNNRHSVGRFLLCAVALVTVGCGGHTPPPATNLEAAQKTLVRALDAWKAGTDPKSLASADTALYVGDENWMRGDRLTKYSLVGSGEQFGTSVRFLVDLQLASKNGASSSKRARYIVVTNPVESIARDDSDDGSETTVNLEVSSRKFEGEE